MMITSISQIKSFLQGKLQVKLSFAEMSQIYSKSAPLLLYLCTLQSFWLAGFFKFLHTLWPSQYTFLLIGRLFSLFLAMIGQCEDHTVYNSLRFVGLAMYEKFNALFTELENYLEAPNNSQGFHTEVVSGLFQHVLPNFRVNLTITCVLNLWHPLISNIEVIKFSASFS